MGLRRVLCLDGGGMRGVYQATYLQAFVSRPQGAAPGAADVGRASISLLARVLADSSPAHWLPAFRSCGLGSFTNRRGAKSSRGSRCAPFRTSQPSFAALAGAQRLAKSLLRELVA